MDHSVLRSTCLSSDPADVAFHFSAGFDMHGPPLQVAKPLLKEISMQKPEAEEELYEDAAELEVSTPRSTSLMNQAAEGMRALGSFFAQAAMGGAEVRPVSAPSLMPQSWEACKYFLSSMGCKFESNAKAKAHHAHMWP